MQAQYKLKRRFETCSSYDVTRRAKMADQKNSHFEGKINQPALNAHMSFIYQSSSKILNILRGKKLGRKFRFSGTLTVRVSNVILVWKTIVLVEHSRSVTFQDAEKQHNCYVDAPN